MPRRGLVLPLAGGLVGVLLCATMVFRTSQALFSGTTANTTNSWATGSVAVSDDDSGSAMFDATAGSLTGGQVLTRCIKVTYGGSLTDSTSVRLYGTAAGTLAAYLTLTIDQGSGTGFGTCSGFTVSTAGIYSGTLSGFAGAATDYSTGVGSWAPAVTGETMTYRFTITVQTAAAAQGSTATAAFTWEARG